VPSEFERVATQSVPAFAHELLQFAQIHRAVRHRRVRFPDAPEEKRNRGPDRATRLNSRCLPRPSLIVSDTVLPHFFADGPASLPILLPDNLARLENADSAAIYPEAA
jgi:hypothetical protein